MGILDAIKVGVPNLKAAAARKQQPLLPGEPGYDEATAGLSQPLLPGQPGYEEATQSGVPRSDDYWRTHPATTGTEVQQKLEAYNRAQAAGVQGQPYPSQSELGLIPGYQSAPNFPTDPLGTPFIKDNQSFSTTGLGGNYKPTSTTPNTTVAGIGSSVQGAFGGAVNGGAGGAAPGGGVASAAGGTGGTGGYLQQLLQNAQDNQQQNVGYVDNVLNPQLGYTASTIADAETQQRGILDTQRQQDAQLQAQYADMLSQQREAEQRANRTDLVALGNYGTAVNQANTGNTAALNGLQSAYGGYSQLSPTAFQSNVQAQQAALSQAGLSQANYQTAAQQRADYKNANYQNALLQYAYANPQDVAAQREALGASTAASNGSLDVQNGGLTPEAKAAQLSALQQYGALTTPEATAKERFLYEQQRNQQEQQEKASREALMERYRLRGAGNSGMELASILQSGQQNSQNRLLGDLGTQAGAVDRSMAALAGYGNLSSTMMGQGNQVALASAGNRLTALGQRGGLASTMRGQGAQESQFNAGSYNRNQEVNANAYNNNQQFNANSYNQNQQFNAGQGNAINMFNAGAYNSNSQFNAGQANNVGMFNAGQANQNSQFNAGQTNQVNMFNTNQNGIQSRFADDYRASQQNDAVNRSNTLFTAQQGTNQTNLGNSGNLLNATTGINNTGYGRTKDSINLQGQGATNVSNAGRATNTAAIGQWNDVVGNATGAAGRNIAVAGLRNGAVSTGGAAIQDALRAKAADDAARDAVASVSGKTNSGPLDWNT